MNALPKRLQGIIEDFRSLEGTEKLEYLLELAENLPPLPPWLQEKRDQMEQVHECMTPVFIFAQRLNGGLSYYFDIPNEAPTVRGYAAILQQGLEGATPEEIDGIPTEFYLQMGLQDVMTGQRLNGLGAILAHMKLLARQKR